MDGACGGCGKLVVVGGWSIGGGIGLGDEARRSGVELSNRDGNRCSKEVSAILGNWMFLNNDPL